MKPILREIKREDIDDALWNSCVAKYGEGRPYPYTWYLDALGKWKGLVLGDYEMIFPLPYHQKYVYQKRIYQPFLSQCFGPIGDPSLSGRRVEFLDYIKAEWSNSQFFFPADTGADITQVNVTKRVNQVINLDGNADTMRSGYTRTRRSQVRHNTPNVKITVGSDIETFLKSYKDAEFPKTKPMLKQWDLFTRILNACKEHNSLEIIKIEDLEGSLLTTAAFVVTESRVVNLIGASSAAGRQHRANAIKIDHMITRHCEQKQVFDFFGSNIPGVNTFNKQFGAVEEGYIEVLV